MQKFKYIKPTQAKLARILRCPNETDRFIKSWESLNALSVDRNYYLKNVCDPEALSDEFGDIDNEIVGLTVHENMEDYITSSAYMTEEDEIQECLLIELECQRMDAQFN